MAAAAGSRGSIVHPRVRCFPSRACQYDWCGPSNPSKLPARRLQQRQQAALLACPRTSGWPRSTGASRATRRAAACTQRAYSCTNSTTRPSGTGCLGSRAGRPTGAPGPRTASPPPCSTPPRRMSSVRPCLGSCWTRLRCACCVLGPSTRTPRIGCASARQEGRSRLQGTTTRAAACRGAAAEALLAAWWVAHRGGVGERRA